MNQPNRDPPDDQSDRDLSVFRRLRERKLFQWGLAYLAGAWILFQVATGVGEQFDWPILLLRSITLLLGIGFFVALVLAWYHGEKGRQRVSGIEVFMLAALLVIAGSVLAVVRRGAEPGPQTSELAFASDPSSIDERSIAVLPFTIRSAREEDMYFAGGMHDDLLTQLAKIDSLTVISRTSMMHYAETTKSVRQIAEELRVATVLEGSVQRSEDRVRLTVQLIDAREDEHLWAESYDEELSTANIFAIQTDLARKIAGTLRAQLTPDVEARLGAQPTESLKAYDHWSHGRYLFQTQATSKDDLDAAAEEFRAAIEADSTYALPWAYLANVYAAEWTYGYRPASEVLPSIRSTVERALELDPDLAFARAALIILLAIEGRYDEAEEAALRALDLSPGLAITHAFYAQALRFMRRDAEAAAAARRALELDPLSDLAHQELVGALYLNRDWDAAISQARKALELNPSNRLMHGQLAYALMQNGQYDEGIKAFEKLRSLDPDNLHRITGLAWAHARAGNREEALRLLDQVPDDRIGPAPLEFATVYGELGELDRAFEYLEWVAESDPRSLFALRGNLAGDSLRADPRFAPLMRRAGFEP